LKPYKKRNVSGRIVVVLGSKLKDRGLRLIEVASRALREKEIHELIITDEVDAKPGGKVDRVAYLGFMEVQVGGVVYVGDKVVLNNRCVGMILGFDETHMLNHMNIVIGAKEFKSGAELKINVEDSIFMMSEA